MTCICYAATLDRAKGALVGPLGKRTRTTPQKLPERSGVPRCTGQTAPNLIAAGTMDFAHCDRGKLIFCRLLVGPPASSERAPRARGLEDRQRGPESGASLQERVIVLRLPRRLGFGIKRLKLSVRGQAPPVKGLGHQSPAPDVGSNDNSGRYRGRATSAAETAPQEKIHSAGLRPLLRLLPRWPCTLCELLMYF